jgi:hypothetical protein
LHIPEDPLEIAVGKNALAADIVIDGDTVSIAKKSDAVVVDINSPEDEKFLIK